MFKEYMGIFKNLRKMQDQLWKDSTANFPGFGIPPDMDQWQQKTLENVNSLMGQAVNQSLELQREWLGQWSERASGKKLQPKLFAELSEEARDSTQRWLDNQNRLWDQWLEFLRGAGGSGKMPDFEQWETAVKESIERQTALLNDWSEMVNVKKLSGKEASKLSGQIEKAMQKSIETQQRLWGHWFQGLGAVAKAAESAAEAEPKKKKAKTAAKPRKASGKPAPVHDDLKQISGIGPGLEKKLKDAGIHTLHEIAGLSDADISHLEEEVIKFSGRINRDKWVEQAKKLIS
jgi:predicted flap endonuclease-1-like 5' DNA nuclease